MQIQMVFLRLLQPFLVTTRGTQCVLTGKPKEKSMVIPWEIFGSITNNYQKDVIQIIGIYRIWNKETNKSYIGQSVDISRRINEHLYKRSQRDCSIDIAVDKYGPDQFSCEVLEECTHEELNNKESAWIAHYKSLGDVYNLNAGGDQASIGSQNGRAKLTEDDVYMIREEYRKKEHTRKEVYEQFKDKIAFSSFASVWDGTTWKHVHQEVYTPESKLYYSKQNTSGGRAKSAIWSNEEVLRLRHRYVNESAKEIYEDYKGKCSFQTLQGMLWGRTYQDVPVYSKKNKKWIEPK